MAALLDRIGEDMKKAMKAGEKHRLETLRTIRADLQKMQAEKRPQGGMQPEDEIAVLVSASKKRRESIDIFRKNGREDLATAEEKELGIIQEYLPAQMSEAEVEQTVRNIIGAAGATSAKDFGRVMAGAMKELKGKADGKVVQTVVKKLLGE